jgi:lipoprotein-anchoring transpeptidase ErfK/SrfK
VCLRTSGQRGGPYCQGHPRRSRDGAAICYTVAVGRPGKQWQGKARVSGKYVRPAWTPPAEVKADNPALPDVIPGGAPNNPMGVAAMTLSGGEYAIHGTNKPESIGKFASYGCIRMHNEDITDLFARGCRHASRCDAVTMSLEMERRSSCTRTR